VLAFASLSESAKSRLFCLDFLVPVHRVQRADERTRTTDLISLRVINHVLQGFAGPCKCRIFRGVSFLCLALCCTVLRSLWYQSGIKSPRVTRCRFLSCTCRMPTLVRSPLCNVLECGPISAPLAIGGFLLI
jgi:hypothetical protein